MVALVREENLYLTFQILVFMISFVIHLFCLYALYKTPHTKLCVIKRLYLANLSLCETGTSLTYGLRRIFLLANVPFESKLFFILEPIQNTGFSLWYLMLMGFITINRFLEIYLNIKYQSTVTFKRACIILTVIFVIPATLAITHICILPDYHAIRYINIVYINPMSQWTLLAISLPIYCYILHKMRLHKRSVKRIRHRFNSNAIIPVEVFSNMQENSNSVKSIINLPVLIIFTFFFFIVVPDQILCFAQLAGFRIPGSALFVIGLCFGFGFISDALICFFMSKAIRETVVKLFCKN